LIEFEVFRSGLDLSVVASEIDSSFIPRVIGRLADVAYGLVFWGAPVKTGYLASTVYKEVSDREATVGVAASYAKFVVEGTAPHEIRPINGGVLAFQLGGRMVFTPLVHHPGTKPNPFMDNAAKGTMDSVGGVVADEWSRLVS
jgi:hypothetical protein